MSIEAVVMGISPHGTVCLAPDGHTLARITVAKALHGALQGQGEAFGRLARPMAQQFSSSFRRLRTTRPKHFFDKHHRSFELGIRKWAVRISASYLLSKLKRIAEAFVISRLEAFQNALGYRVFHYSGSLFLFCLSLYQIETGRPALGAGHAKRSTRSGVETCPKDAPERLPMSNKPETIRRRRCC